MTGLSLLVLAMEALPQAVEPPRNFIAFDTPNDDGASVSLMWDRMPYDSKEVRYKILAALQPGGPAEEVDSFESDRKWASERRIPWWAGKKSKDLHYVTLEVAEVAKVLARQRAPDVAAAIQQWEERLKAIDQEIEALNNEQAKLTETLAGEALQEARRPLQARVQELEAQKGKAEQTLSAKRSEMQPYADAIARAPMHFALVVIRGEQEIARSGWVSAQAAGNWFDLRKLHSFGLAIVFCAIIVGFIQAGKRRRLFLRKIPGLDAIDEAIGRAVEMGKPVYYLAGRHDINEINTIAAVTILGQVAKKCALLGAQLKVPHAYVLVYAVSQEITKQAYIEAGRPDAYRDDINFRHGGPVRVHGGGR